MKTLEELTPRQQDIWNNNKIDRFWYIYILHNSWGAKAFVGIKDRPIDRNDFNKYVKWCEEMGDNMYPFKEDARNRIQLILAAFK